MKVSDLPESTRARLIEDLATLSAEHKDGDVFELVAEADGFALRTTVEHDLYLDNLATGESFLVEEGLTELASAIMSKAVEKTLREKSGMNIGVKVSLSSAAPLGKDQLKDAVARGWSFVSLDEQNLRKLDEAGYAIRIIEIVQYETDDTFAKALVEIIERENGDPFFFD